MRRTSHNITFEEHGRAQHHNHLGLECERGVSPRVAVSISSKKLSRIQDTPANKYKGIDE